MIGIIFMVLLITRFGFRRDLGTSTLQALEEYIRNAVLHFEEIQGSVIALEGLV
ncbi:MAG: hypothetical protein QOJ42_245 [Acidobacteriaceae bacterium]|jgi:hypothetical protein|nr:hypothetical protein [Acidobacteriaceae bacterium]